MDKVGIKKLVDRELGEIAGNQNRLRSLLLSKKDSLGKNEEDLIFLGMANLAEYFWCAEESYLKSRKKELDFFFSYLSDRIRYSVELGSISKFPVSANEILEIGEGIKIQDIERLLQERENQFVYNDLISAKVAIEGQWKTIGVHDRVLYILGYPDEFVGKNDLQEFNANEVVFVKSLDDPALPPLLRGFVGEYEWAEKYPTIRWNFSHGYYTIVGIPDGITSDFVYEFKTSRNSFLKGYLKPVAEIQADFSGHFFRREKKRVQIRVSETGNIETYQSQVSSQRVLQVLKGFKLIDEGETPIPPKPWKCKHCEFNQTCSISQVVM